MSEYFRALNRLCKWRTVFTGRWIGTRSRTDPEAIAIRDVCDKYLILRAEASALTALLIARGVITELELERQIITECDHLQRALEAEFPGFTATDAGMSMDPRSVETTRHWPP